MNTVKYITPNDIDVMGSSDSESIQNAINKAKGKADTAVLIPRLNERTKDFAWNISKAILLPSDISVVLDNCYMRLEDGIYDNIFRNENLYDKSRTFTDKGRQENIFIRGIGNVFLDGGEPNGLMEMNSGKDGKPTMDANNLILLHNVHGFAIENIKVMNQRWWAINVLFSSNGVIKNIDVYGRNNIPNQDGVDIRIGCSNLIIENITGQSGDDLVAITATGGNFRFRPKDADIDVHDIKINNVLGTSVRQGIVALRNHDGARLYNIHVTNVFDTGNNDRNNTPYGVVRLGENLYYRVRPSEMGETFNIHISNVFSKNEETICIGGTIKDCSFSNIYASGTVRSIFATDSLPHQDGGVKMEDVEIKNISYMGDVHKSCIFDFKNMRESDYIRSVSVDNISGAHIQNIGKLKSKQDIQINNISVKEISGPEYIYLDSNDREEA